MRAKTGTAAAERISRARPQESRLTAVDSQAQEPLAPGLDRLIHERMRLGIVSALAVNPWLTFNELKTTARERFVMTRPPLFPDEQGGGGDTECQNVLRTRPVVAAAPVTPSRTGRG